MEAARQLLMAVLRFVFVTVNNLYCIPTYAFWMFLLLPVLHWKPEVYWFIEGQLFHMLLTMVSSWSWSAGYTIQEVGDDISTCHNQECLLVVNHQSTADVPILMAAFQNKRNVLSNMMWLMDRFFKFTNFGLVSVIHGDFFIQSGKNVRDCQLQNLRDHLTSVYSARRRKWLVLFPEGGFLLKRKETSQRYAAKNNLPALELVSLPRLGAMHVIVTSLNPIQNTSQQNAATRARMSNSDDSTATNRAIVDHRVQESYTVENRPTVPESDKKQEPLKWIIDVTIGYPDQEPLSLFTLCSGLRPPCATTICYRRYPIEEVPTDMDELTKWLYDRWVEKEHMLAKFYKTGKFPALPSTHSQTIQTPRPIILSNFWIVLYNLFFIASTLFHYYAIKRVLCI